MENRRRLSLVDCVSFEFMRRQGISDVLGLDRHFEEAGYRLLPHGGDSRRGLHTGEIVP